MSLNIFETKAQVFEVAENLNLPTGLTISGTDLYFASIADGNILKIDMTDTNLPVIPTIVASNVPDSRGIAMSGENLYVLYSDNKIAKIDLTVNPPIKTDIVTGIFLTGLAVDDNTLYYSDMGSQFGGDIGKVYKLDLNIPNAEPVVLVENFNAPANLKPDGTVLYFVQNGPYLSTRKVLKIDLLGDFPATPTELVTDFDNFVNDFDIRGNEIYVIDREVDNSKIIKADISGDLPATPSDFIIELLNPISLLFNENDLYVAEMGQGMIEGEGKILKYTLEPAVGIGEIDKKIQL
ncbi:MAG: hypothetical protein ACPG5B_12315 [Chitinophagales bacterium]